MYEIMSIYLENGLRVILHKIPNSRTFACGLWVKQGSNYENDKNNGISHLLEHLIVTTNNSNSMDSLVNKITVEGLMYNATTSKEFTSYYMSGISSKLEVALSSISQLIIDFDKKIDKNLFENEKKIVEREALEFYSSFKQIRERSAQALYGNNGLGRIIVGSINNIRNISIDDIWNVYNNSYTPSNSNLVIVGDINYNNAIELANKYFSTWEDKETNILAEPINKEPSIYFNAKSGTESSIISLCFKTPPFNCEIRNNIEILSIILGNSGISSRIVKEIRSKRGLAYIINSLENFYRDVGVFCVTSVCSNKSVEDIVKIMLEVILEAREFGFNEEEVLGAKNILITKKLLNIENVSDHLNYLGRCACYDNIFSLEKEIRNIKKSNPFKIQTAANHIFTNENVGFACIGDINIDSVIDLIKLN